MLIEDVFGQLGDTFGVGFGLKLESLLFEEELEFLVVGNDTIVNDGEFPCWVGSDGKKIVSIDVMILENDNKPVWMTIDSGWWTMSCPSSVCNTSVAFEDLFEIDVGAVNHFSEFDNLANFFKGNDIAIFISVDGKTGRIVSTVF
jgi:hypothetical protein